MTTLSHFSKFERSVGAAVIHNGFPAAGVFVLSFKRQTPVAGAVFLSFKCQTQAAGAFFLSFKRQTPAAGAFF